MSRVIVTGASGFVGRAVVPRLLSLGYDVKPWSEPLDAIRHCRQAAQVVVHLAAASRQSGVANDPGVMETRNLSGIEAVLDYCKVSGARCVFASTAGVYLHEGAVPLDEDGPVAPRDAYAESKLAGEMLCRSASATLGIQCTILRLFNVYGPGQRPPFLIPCILESITERRTIELKMPEAIRDFVFVDDVAQAFVVAATRLVDGSDVFNVGTGRGTRVTDVMRVAARLLAMPAEWSVRASPCGEAAFSVADIRRARTQLGWDPAVELEQGLASTCARWSGSAS